MPTHPLPRGHTLLVVGPASVRLHQGDAASLGAPLSNTAWTIVVEQRHFPIETENGASVDIRLGRSGKFDEVDQSTIPTSWREASQILCQSPGMVAILGDVDSGKSTLCTLFANECFKQGVKVRIIDADIGQADIGPPATISISSLKRHIFTLQELRPEASLFMGDTSPSSIIEKLTQGVIRLKNSGQSDALLVNTDGWIRDHDAIRYKLQLVDAIQPDFVFGIGDEVEALLENQKSTALKLNRSTYARTRTREERKRAREYGYRRFLQKAERLELRLTDIKLRRFNSYHQLTIREDENLRGVLAGLLDGEDMLLSIARVESLRNGRLTLKAVSQAEPRTVELGSLILSPRYEELGFEP